LRTRTAAQGWSRIPTGGSSRSTSIGIVATAASRRTSSTSSLLAPAWSARLLSTRRRNSLLNERLCRTMSTIVTAIAMSVRPTTPAVIARMIVVVSTIGV
jgi:hypothetical protein